MADKVDRVKVTPKTGRYFFADKPSPEDFLQTKADTMITFRQVCYGDDKDSMAERYAEQTMVLEKGTTWHSAEPLPKFSAAIDG